MRTASSSAPSPRDMRLGAAQAGVGLVALGSLAAALFVVPATHFAPFWAGVFGWATYVLGLCYLGALAGLHAKSAAAIRNTGRRPANTTAAMGATLGPLLFSIYCLTRGPTSPTLTTIPARLITLLIVASAISLVVEGLCVWLLPEKDEEKAERPSLGWAGLLHSLAAFLFILAALALEYQSLEQAAL